MKIGFDASDLCTDRADGTTRYTRELLKRLPALMPNDEFHVFAPGENTFSIFKNQFSNIQWHASPWPKYWTQSRLPIDLFKVRPDVLFMPIQQLPSIRPAGMKTISVVHDLAFHQFGSQYTFKDWLLLHVFSAQVAREADQIIAVSQSTANDIARFYGRTNNVHVVPHGVDHTQFRPAMGTEKQDAWQKLLNLYPRLKAPYILTLGQIQPRKNLVRLVAAFEQFTHNKAYAHYQLVIGGAHGWLQEPILKRIKTSVKVSSIHLLGRVPENLLPGLYWNADVFALVSLYEGFGLSALEALASGTSVVASNVSSLPEIIGEAGVLVNPNHAGSIRDGFVQALKRGPQLRDQGIEQARKFTWDRTAQSVVNILKHGKIV